MNENEILYKNNRGLIYFTQKVETNKNLKQRNPENENCTRKRT